MISCQGEGSKYILCTRFKVAVERITFEGVWPGVLSKEQTNFPLIPCLLSAVKLSFLLNQLTLAKVRHFLMIRSFDAIGWLERELRVKGHRGPVVSSWCLWG